MVEVGEEEADLDHDKVPGEDDEPDMAAYGSEEEELVPIKPKVHGGLFGADFNAVKF